MIQWANVVWGARKGAFWGILYAVVAAILYVVDSGPQRFDRNGINIGPLFLVYLFGGFFAGVILGVFRPALQRRVPAAGVSILAAAPISIGVIVLVTGKASQWGASEWLGTLVSSIVFGVIGMTVLWKDRDWL